MKKVNFVSLVMGCVGGIPLAIGMCMCLLPEWNAFRPGILVGAIGAALLLAIIPMRRRMEGKPPVRFTARTVGAVLLGVAGAAALGIGMSMALVRQDLLPVGIPVGIAGIVLLLGLIPVCRGIR